MTNLTSTVSHEMRTPLTAVQTFIDNLIEMQNGPENPKLACKIMNLIKYQIHMLLCFVNDLLDLRQISENLFQVKASVFDPNLVIQLIIDMFEPQAKSQSVSLTFDVARQLQNPKDRNSPNFDQA